MKYLILCWLNDLGHFLSEWARLSFSYVDVAIIAKESMQMVRAVSIWGYLEQVIRCIISLR